MLNMPSYMKKVVVCDRYIKYKLVSFLERIFFQASLNYVRNGIVTEITMKNFEFYISHKSVPKSTHQMSSGGVVGALLF